MEPVQARAANARGKEFQMIAALTPALPVATTIVIPGIVVLILIILLLLWIF
jgi:hypothetical protein